MIAVDIEQVKNLVIKNRLSIAGGLAVVLAGSIIFGGGGSGDIKTSVIEKQYSEFMARAGWKVDFDELNIHDCGKIKDGVQMGCMVDVDIDVESAKTGDNVGTIEFEDREVQFWKNSETGNWELTNQQQFMTKKARMELSDATRAGQR
ncbi:hypothetical protein [Photobacterium kishitanii]|uniref:Uncharacterized protein n=1 Tax=Photobacterium kishitanii TaxID=318456 RepID=A0A2T3KL73_9GAMM|nr:hypothetical protein [Photobacterium kishitanii]PSV00400.1 hypothetical protein C9J27_04530 [Photobacterium kishitanii]